MDEEERAPLTERNTFGATLTEGDLNYKVLKERETEFDCCFMFNLNFLAILAGVIQGYQIGIIAGTELLIGDEYSGIDFGNLHEDKPTTQEREFFVSFFALGAAFGALFGGQLSDLIGRKWVSVMGDGFVATGFIFIILTDGIFAGFFGRFISGFGQGLTSFSIPMYISELGALQSNKMICAIFTLASGCGMVFGLNIAIPLRHQWKLLYEIGLIPCACLAIFLIFLPESQAYYVNKGMDDEALEVLKTGLQEEDARLELQKLKYERRFYQSSNLTYWTKMGDIFGTFLKPFIYAVILSCLSQFAGTSAFLYYGPEIIEMLGAEITDEKEESADILDNFIIIAFVCGNIAAALIIGKYGRRKMVLSSLPAAFFGAIFLSFTMHEANYGDEDEPNEAIKQEYRHLDRMIFFGFLVAYMASISIGLSGAVWSITYELFPNYLLAQVSSLIATIGWLVNFGVNSIFLNISDDPQGRWVIFLILGAFVAVAYVFVWLILPETIGKTVKENLEEIIGKEALDKKRSQTRKEYGIKDIDVNAKSDVVKQDIENTREQYRCQQQY